MRSILQSVRIRLSSVQQMMNISRHVPLASRVKQECIRLRDAPLLSSIVKRYQKMQPLKNYTILNIQHQLGDVSAQVEALMVLGAMPNDLYFLPPSYSHNKQFEIFLNEQFDIPKENMLESSSYRLRYNYDKYRLLNVIYSLNRMSQMESRKKQGKNNNLLVLDDGGCFSEALSILFDINECILDPEGLVQNLPICLKISCSDVESILSYLKSVEIRLVEQTSRGLFKYIDQPKIALALRKLDVSLADVASSEPKKRLEPTIIAETCLNMLSYLFYDAPSCLLIPKPSKSDKCLLLGYGAIGQAIAYALTHTGDLGMLTKDSVQIWDTDVTKRESAENDGFQVFNQWNNKDAFNYIIGCAGRCSLPISSLSLSRSNSYLISVSSAAIEFPFHEMIQHASEKPSNTQIRLADKELKRLSDENIHQNVAFTIENEKSVTVVNGGMPITFLGMLNPTNPERFDLTISLMVAASIQAALTKQKNNQPNRTIPLDMHYSSLILNWFEKQSSTLS